MLATLSKIFSIGEKFVLTDEHKRCLDILENTDTNLFLTGKAGTGKTTLIHHFRNNTRKKVVVLAPTGIAAINIRGQTIHSFFKFPPRFLDPKSIKKSSNARIYMDVDCIVLDEISMVRADVLDAIDLFMRLHGRDKNAPFGGVQMVFVGDMYQLPPIVRNEESELFSQFYNTPYFFSSNVFLQTAFAFIELQTIFRQKERDFVEVLNKIRVGEANVRTMELINEQVDPAFDRDDHVILCTTNKVAEAINQTKLNRISQPLFNYQAYVEGNFPTEDRVLPAEFDLKLKKGARVLFVKNDPGGQWVNGSLGVVHHLEQELIRVMMDDTGKLVDVYQDTWENIRYQVDPKTHEITTEVLGKFKQYPLKLAWAITIHKSQGMTFEKVCLDFSRSPFAHGQTYVALSRCRTLKGLVLTRKIWPNDILLDPRIVSFMKELNEQSQS